MEEIKLSNDVSKKLKYFDNDNLTEEQELLIDKLILNEELKERYKKYGLCEECRRLNTGRDIYYRWCRWCQSCNAKHFQQNFKNWTSGNHDIDEYIQNSQLKAKCCEEVLEWIEYDKFENVEYLNESVYKAIWKDGYTYCWRYSTNQWGRLQECPVTLKCFSSHDNTVELLKAIESDVVDRCYGFTKDPEMNNFMMVIVCKHDVCEECRQPNTGSSWCQSCNAKHFQQNFKNWTSKNRDIDESIQNSQLKAKCCKEVLEWIEYDKFENVEYLTESVYKAIWKDGYICWWDSENNQWKRYREYYKEDQTVTLKCLLHDSQNIKFEFLNEIESHSDLTCYGITKHPETNNYMMVFSIEEFKLSDDIFEQIKYFNYLKLNNKQELLIDKLILNEELKGRYKNYDLCHECNQPNTGDVWCQTCNAKHFQQNFKNWTSGNHDIDECIQNLQVKAKCNKESLEWVEYDKFENVEYLTQGVFGTVCKAIRKDGNIYRWYFEKNQWGRYGRGCKVALKCLHNSQDITAELLREEIESGKIVCCYGITKDPETNNFMIVMKYDTFINHYIKHGVCKKCGQPNTGFLWCQSCNAQHFQQNFKNWRNQWLNIKFIHSYQ